MKCLRGQCAELKGNSAGLRHPELTDVHWGRTTFDGAIEMILTILCTLQTS